MGIKKGIELARKHNRVDRNNRERHFAGMTHAEIRSILKANGLNPHMEIWFDSTEVAIITPEGILLHMRPADNGKLGLWGGILKNNKEGAGYGAIRKVYEETGLILTISDLTPDEFHSHSHRYANGDKAFFYTNRFIVRMDSVPAIIFDEADTTAVVLINADNIDDYEIIDDQLPFIRRLLNID